MADIQALADADALAFPLTCHWCQRAPATHLLVFDYGDRRIPNLTCQGCAHLDRLAVRAIAKAPALAWLFRLVADDCETDESAVRAQLGDPDDH